MKKSSFMLIYLITMIISCIIIIAIIAYKVGFDAMGITLIVTFAIIGLICADVLRLWFQFEHCEEQIIYKDIIFYRNCDDKYRAYDDTIWYDNQISAYQHYLFSHMEELLKLD